MTSTSLEQLQRDFADWMVGDPNGTIEALVDGRGLTPRDRLQIYRSMVTDNFTNALATAYPMTKRLVGDEFFDAACARYIVEFPSRRGDLQAYGEHLPRLLADIQEDAGPGYLEDVAHLEWARQECALSPLTAPLTLDGMAVISRHRYPDILLDLTPSLRLVNSRYPVLDIWMYCRDPGDEQLTIGTAGQAVAVWRSGEQISMIELDEDCYDFVAAITAGASLSEAQRAATRHGRLFDPATLLGWLFGEEIVTGVSFLDDEAVDGASP